MLLNLLKKFYQEQELVSLYTNPNDTCKFIMGYILACNENYFIMALISPQGKGDGLLLKETDSVYMATVDEQYCHKILKLMEYHHTQCTGFSFENSNLVKGLLHYAKENRSIISIELFDSGDKDIIGYIDAVKDDVCSVNQITEDGKADGVAFCELSNITKISCDSEDEQIIKILNK